MNDSINSGGLGRWGRPAALLAALLVLSPAGSALAQDESQAPAAETAAGGIDFPIMLGGELLSAETYSGAEWLEQTEGDQAQVAAFTEEAEALVAGVGKSLADLTVKSALYQPSPGNHAVVLAMRIAGVDAREFVVPAVDLLLADITDPGLLLRPLDDKWALRVVDTSMPGVYPRTIYLRDDTAWFIEGDDEDYIWDALDQLPDPLPVGESEADSLYTDVPLTLDGKRRVGLYETTEPLFLPTLGERLGESIDPWLTELYLEAGISPSEMIGIWAWWGLPSPDSGFQIEGYRLPARGDELLGQLYRDVFLARPAEGDLQGIDEFGQPLDVGFSEGEIAGRAVTTLDYGGSFRHIFASEDGSTVWVLSDVLGEPEMVEAAVAALP